MVPKSIELIDTGVAKLLKEHRNHLSDLPRKELIQHSAEKRFATVSKNGALNYWTEADSTGRSPKDTYIVQHPESANEIDWDSPNSKPLHPDFFDDLLEEAVEVLEAKETIYSANRVIGADSSYALPCTTVSCSPLTMVFADNMFRAVPKDINDSIFYDKDFLLLVLPHDKLNTHRQKANLRIRSNGMISDLIIAMDFDRRIGLVYGSSYCGSVKKTMFTVMNYYLPKVGILPLHCSANEGKDGDSTLLLGLSGTGKTTLSADPERALLGDDEHGWNDIGIANFENGCFAKLINLREEKEPEIYNAVFHADDYLNHGAIVENCMMFPDGTYDVDDERLTPNSRASYPLEFLTNIKKSSVSGHPNVILFLTADANGVLPPVAKLSPEQAMLWFLMGYTSKLAGTETDVTEPVSTFSRFFGEPFMPANPDVYAKLLGEKMEKHNTNVYLINTGWSGGPYGIGERMDIDVTRNLVDCAIKGKLEDAVYEEDPLFHLSIPKLCVGINAEILNPRNTWLDKEAFEERAQKLAQDFSDHFDKVYGDKNIDPKITAQCPGK